MPETILDEYLKLTGSTTRFLEQLAGADISATVVSQTVDEQAGVIIRVSTLHAGDSKPMLAASCRLCLANLKVAEREALLNSSRPIGDILLSGGTESFRRQDVTVDAAGDHALSVHLPDALDSAMIKSFDLWYGDRFIGHLEEVTSLSALRNARRQEFKLG